MTLGEVLSGAGLIQPLAPELASVDVSGLEYDSRRVGTGVGGPGTEVGGRGSRVGDAGLGAGEQGPGGPLFFAFPGAKVDGRQFAADALARGAIAVVSESKAPAELASRWIRVRHGRESL